MSYVSLASATGVFGLAESEIPVLAALP